MFSTHSRARVGAAVAAAALFITLITSASAQTAPYTAFGMSQKAGAKIAANIAGKSCGPDATVSAAGDWLIRIAITSACTPNERDVVSFTIDGVPAEQTVTWTAGGAPPNVATGIALTAKPVPAAGAFSGGTIARAGVSIVAFTGTTAQLNSAGATMKLTSVSATVSGKMLTFVVGAPDFVNTEFNSAFTGGMNGALVMVVANGSAGVSDEFGPSTPKL